MKVQIPCTFWQDAEDSIMDEADRGNDVFASLIAKVQRGKIVRRGRGYTIEVDLNESECESLLNEALYKYEYWGTDAYGVDCKDYTKAAAAKRLMNRLR